MSLDWTMTDTLQLIHDYKDTPLLWDPQFKDKVDPQRRTELWGKLADKFGKTVLETKKKMKNLRTQFYRERKAGFMKGTDRRWVYYEPLSFLDTLSQEPKDYEYKLPAKREPDTGGACAEVFFFNDEPQNKRGKMYEEEARGEEENETVEVSDVNPLDSGYAYHEAKYQGPGRDEFAVFGEHVGNELRRLGRTAQIYAKRDISEVLFKAAIGEYDKEKRQSQGCASETT